MSDTQNPTPEQIKEAMQRVQQMMPENLLVPMGVYGDGEALFINQSNGEESELSADQVLEMINEDVAGNETKRALKGKLYAIYVAQHIAQEQDVVLNDDVGFPAHFENGRVGFTFLRDTPEIKTAMESAIKNVDAQMEENPALGEAKAIFVQLAKMQIEQAQSIKNPVEFIFKQTCFQWLSAQDIEEFADELKEEEQTPEVESKLERLSRGRDMITQYNAAIAEMQRRREAETKVNQEPPLAFRPDHVNEDGTITLENLNTKDMETFTADELLSMVREKSNLDILSVFTAYTALKLYQAQPKSSTPQYGDFVRAELEERFHDMAFEIDGKILKAGPDQNDPNAPAFRAKKLHSDVTAVFTPLDKDAYQSVANPAVLPDLCKEVLEELQSSLEEGDVVAKALEQFVAFTQMENAPFSLDREIYLLFTQTKTIADVEAEHKRSRGKNRDMLNDVLETMKAKEAKAKAEMAANDKLNAERAKKTAIVLERGKQTERANEIWTTIRDTAERDHHNYEMLMHFSPTAKEVISSDADKFSSNPYDELALDWRAATDQNVIDALGGNVSPSERGAIELLLDAAENTFRSNIIAELIAHDPWLTTRKERTAFRKEAEARQAPASQGWDTADYVEMWDQSGPTYNLYAQIHSDGEQSDHDVFLHHMMRDDLFRETAKYNSRLSGGISGMFAGKSSVDAAKKSFARAYQKGDLSKTGIDAERLEKIVEIIGKVSSTRASVLPALFTPEVLSAPSRKVVLSIPYDEPKFIKA